LFQDLLDQDGRGTELFKGSPEGFFVVDMIADDLVVFDDDLVALMTLEHLVKPIAESDQLTRKGRIHASGKHLRLECSPVEDPGRPRVHFDIIRVWLPQCTVSERARLLFRF
jgi:hypothetical protein